MEKEVKCPWCKEETVPKVKILKKQYGDVKERRCTKCGKVLAAYLEGEGNFLPKIRTFKD
jgi:phage FluMu protein Com